MVHSEQHRRGQVYIRGGRRRTLKSNEEPWRHVLGDKNTLINRISLLRDPAVDARIERVRKDRDESSNVAYNLEESYKLLYFERARRS